MKSFCIGMAVGLASAFALSSIPAVRTTVNDLKRVVDDDIITPIKNAINRGVAENAARAETDVND